MKIDVQQTDRSTPDRPMWHWQVSVQEGQDISEGFSATEADAYEQAGRALDRMKRIPRVIVADAAEHYERVIHEALEPSEVR